MTATMVFPSLYALPRVGLAEIEERAALQSRVDRKYVVPVGEVGWLLDTLGPSAAVLEIEGVRHFTYESLYFDTPDLTSYRMTAHRHRRRFKIRTRTYVDSGTCWLEVKVPGPRGSTVKYRAPHQPEHQHTVGAGRSFLEEIFARHDLAARIGAEFGPTLRTQYLRFALLLPASESRVTVDTHLRWTADGRELQLPQTAIIETKTGSAASFADRRLWQRGHRPVAISKYATGLAAIRADLPAAPWQRVLRRHFTAPREDMLNA
jgi:hypothetical protein